MSWDSVEVGLAGGEETVNFGPRNETGSTLYQVDTLASVSPRETVQECPSVLGASSEEGFSLAVRSQLLVFDASCCTLHATLSFDGAVDAMAWSEGSHFLAIAERCGRFHFAHSSTKEVLFSQELVSDVSASDGTNGHVFLTVTFTPRNSDGTYNLIIVSASGMLFQFSNLALEELHEAIENQDLGQVSKLRSAIQLDRIDLQESHKQTLSGVAVGCLYGETVLISYGSGISIWGKDPNDNNLAVLDSVGSYILEGSNIVKASVTNDGNFLVVLDEKQMLSLWAVNTLVMVAFWPHVAVEDFILLSVTSVETPGSITCDTDAYKIVLLTAQSEEKRYIQVYSFPSMKQVYSLEIPRLAFLAECPCTQESIYFIEGVADHLLERAGEAGEIKALRVRCLTEAMPENRLSRLLHKRYFEAAETFARQFGLDVELVYKVKANSLLDMVSPWSYAGNEGPERSEPAEQFALTELKSCLTNIKDDDYVAKCCLQAALLTLEETYDLLSYARTRKSSVRMNGTDRAQQGLSTVLTEVLEALDRLATFEMAFGVASFSGTRWQQFLTADLMVEITKCLAQGEVASAVIMWRRHQSTFEANFSAEKLESVLSSVRQDMPSAEIIPWLQDDLVPFVMKVLPQPGLSILASWLEKRARDMELTEKAGWPSNSLALASVLLSASKSVSESAFGRGLATPQQFVNQVCSLPAAAKALSGAQEKTGNGDELRSLMVLVQQLTELVQLHTKYGCHVPLAEFVQETSKTIAFRLLDRVIAVELIPVAINKQIGPYMVHHGLRRDAVLLEYIQHVARDSSRSNLALSNSLVEARIIAVNSCIGSKELRCKATLEVMLYASPPWSESVEKLVAEAKEAFPSNQEFSEQYRLVELKKMLCRYGMRSYHVSYSSRAKGMARFILTKDQPSAMDDALKVVNAYSHMSEAEAYSFRMQKLCKEGKVIECVDLLESLPEPKAREYAEELVVWLCQILEEELYEELELCKDEHITAAKAAVAVLKFMQKRDMDSYVGVGDRLHSLKSIAALQTEFNVFLSVDDYDSADVRRKLVEKQLGRYLSSGNDKTDTANKNSGADPTNDKTYSSYSKLQRFCKLMGISRDELKAELALRATESDDLTTALELCGDLSDYAPTPAAANTLFRVAHSLCRRVTEGSSGVPKNLTNRITDLLSRAATYCSSDLLCDCLEFAKGSSLANSAYSQCESGDYGFSVQTTAQSSTQDSFTEWTFDERFREDGLVLDSFVALPLAFRFCLVCVPDCSDVMQYCQLRVAGCSMNEDERRAESDRSQAVESGQGESGPSLPQPSPVMLASAAGLNIIRHLQENNQYQLALSYLVETLGVCLQHYSVVSLSRSHDGQADKQIPLSNARQQLTQITQMAIKMLNEIIGSLLVKAFQCRTVDHSLGLGLLCSIPRKTAFDKLTSRPAFLGQSTAKVLSLAKIGIDFALLCKDSDLLRYCQVLALNATWGQNLSKLKLSFSDVYKSDSEERRQLLSEMIKHPKAELDMILEFCRAYSLDEDDALLMYVENQLLPSAADGQAPPSLSPSWSAAEGAAACHMAGKPCAGRDYQNTVTAVVERISRKKDFIKLLVDVATKIDAYDYDKIQFILLVMKKLTPDEGGATVEKGIQLLKYLQHYERTSVPTSYERTFCLSAKKKDDPEKICLNSELPLSALSASRLPFHPLLYGDPWLVLASELSDQTVPKLLGVAKLLKIPSDQLYLTAIQNLFKSAPSALSQATVNGPAGGNTSNAVQAHKGKSFKFDRAKNMLYAIHNLGMAIATAKWVAKQLPVGEEKVAALKTCVDLAEKAKNSCAPEVRSIYPQHQIQKEAEKAQLTCKLLWDLCRAVQTEHVLHQYHVADPALLALVSQPAKLICCLYRTCGDREPGASSQSPDAHECSEEVAAVNNKDIGKIRCHLIEKWLVSSQNDAQAPHSGSVIENGLGEEDLNDESEKNLRRVIYILQFSPVEESVAFLLNIAYKASSATIHDCCRLRALRALFAVAPTDTIEKLCRKPVASVRAYMESLVCITELDGLHVQQSLSAFQKCNKEGLVRGLWRNHKHERKAVRLVADLCLDNRIHEPQLWNSLLQQLLAFAMVKYLRRVLISLAGVSALWQVPCLPHVWRSVLMAPFKSVSPPLSDDEKSSCQKSAALLQRCPLLLDLDIYSIAVQFHKVALPAHALACLVLIPPTAVRQQHIKTLLDTGCAVEVLDQLEAQRKLGKTLTRADIVQQEVFRYIEDNQHYQILVDTPYCDALVSFLINTKNITGLLMKTLEGNRLENAVQVVQLYHRVHPNSVTARFAAENDLSDFEHLWAFLEMNGLLERAMPFLPQSAEPAVEEQAEELECARVQDEHGVAANVMFMKVDDSACDFPI